MFNWAEKIIVKGILRRLLKKLPKFRDKAFVIVEEHGEHLIGKVFKAVEQVVTDFAKKLEN